MTRVWRNQGALLLWEQRVAGSSPAARTKSEVAAIAQLEERRSVEPEAAGSKPAGGASLKIQCVWGWPSPSGLRLKVVTLASPVRIRSVNPKRIRTPRGGNGRRNGLRSRGRKACPFDPGRGDQHSQE